MKKIFLILSLLLIPIQIFAYSNEVILGGNTLGIEVISDGVMVVGFYKVNGKYNKGNPNIEIGDYITEINNEKVSSVSNLTNLINKYSDDEYVNITYVRNDKEYSTKLSIIKDGNVYKTGLYVKDSISGIGTLTYIDPTTMIYGALGHEILESNTNEIIDISGGTIFRNSVTSIDKSTVGNPGSKNAEFFYNTSYGSVLKNTIYGIYGIYDYEFDDSKLISVAENDEVKIGHAVMYTVVNDEKIESFNINITKINETSDIKNITFEIVDDRLIDISGGVVQGMSGSPIVQNNKIIGAVTHVIVDNPVTGYGLFITTMLEEGEN